jgi:lysozyme family protein
MDAFEAAVEHLMDYEVGGWVNVKAPGFVDGSDMHACGYVNDPSDPGGETKYGIAKNAHPNIRISSLNWAQATAIYSTEYWTNTHCDQMPGRYAALHFDIAVNLGGKRAALFLQQALGIVQDGSLGPITLAATNAADPIDLCNEVSEIRKQYYNSIVANNPSQQKYLAGWLRRANELQDFTTDPNNFN